MIESPLLILAILCGLVYGSEWLAEKTWLRYLSPALLVILLTAILANLGLIPSASNAPPIYGHIFTYVAPISIFLLLLEVNLRQLRSVGLPMLGMFLLGAVGTCAGVILGMSILGGAEAFGAYTGPLAGMFAGTYIGGSVNFNAVALEFQMQETGPIYAGAVAIDNIITAIWMMLCLGLPKWLEKKWSSAKALPTPQPASSSAGLNGLHQMSILELGMLGVLALGGLWLADVLAAWSKAAGFAIPQMLWLTTIAIGLAQFPFVQRLKSSQTLGLFLVYIFLAVIGAYCELSTLGEIGDLAGSLLLFTSSIMLVHGLIIFGLGQFWKRDWSLIAIASQSNIGGGSTGLALTNVMGRPELALPAVLVGSLGNGLGTYAGFAIAGYFGAAI
ncbi:MAG: DUF819 family protein [Bacteroidota bacterium]